jgi:hypothetical protein
MDVMEDLWILVSNMLLNMVSLLNLLILIKLLTKNVNLIKENSKSLNSLMSALDQPQDYKKLLLNKLSLLPLMLLTGNSIHQELSLTVKLLLITELPLLDILIKVNGSLKTLGDLVGEKKDILD